ncbi:unnamed protein product [Cyprideis torosa]|uniref:Uncharacterized protein n=1 Tax=Cyprideis torosa TaxID=163714 RepID=A0A7R8WFX5_9CRUS|nr:unnamed protein product [Cyprideis torosa]CAG0891122.1 unnamed protein product [Cyprideis torosa]
MDQIYLSDEESGLSDFIDSEEEWEPSRHEQEDPSDGEAVAAQPFTVSLRSVLRDDGESDGSDAEETEEPLGGAEGAAGDETFIGNPAQEAEEPPGGEVKLEKSDPEHLYVRSNFENDFKRICLTKRGRRADVQDLNLMWPNGRPITTAKRNDLRSILFLIPENRRGNFRDFNTDNELDEDQEGIDGFTEYDPEESHGISNVTLLSGETLPTKECFAFADSKAFVDFANALSAFFHCSLKYLLSSLSTINFTPLLIDFQLYLIDFQPVLIDIQLHPNDFQLFLIVFKLRLIVPGLQCLALADSKAFVDFANALSAFFQWSLKYWLSWRSGGRCFAFADSKAFVDSANALSAFFHWSLKYLLSWLCLMDFKPLLIDFQLYLINFQLGLADFQVVMIDFQVVLIDFQLYLIVLKLLLIAPGFS